MEDAVSTLEYARERFSAFEGSLEDADARTRLKEAIDAILDILEGDYDAKTKSRAKNVTATYRRMLAQRAEQVLNAKPFLPFQTYRHYADLADVFIQGYPESDKNLERLKGKLRVQALLGEFRWLSKAEQEGFLRTVGALSDEE